MTTETRYFLNRSNGAKQHVYREYFNRTHNCLDYSPQCGCPGTNNGHTQAHGQLVEASASNARNVCKRGMAFLMSKGLC